jgi:hypothetical protein
MGWLSGREKKGRGSMKIDLFNNKKLDLSMEHVKI